MIVKQFLVSVTCYDAQPPSADDLVDAIYHGMLEHSGTCRAVEWGSERVSDCPDPDFTKDGAAFDREIGEWDRVAEEVMNGRRS